MTLFITVLMALISYFTAKKSGASDAQALLAGAAAGAGTYYVATETEWGQKLFESSSQGTWVAATNADGSPLLDSNGKQVYVPQGETVTKNPDGTIKVASDGTWFTKTLDTTGKVLTSWGGAGTATVIGTTALAADGISKYVPWLLVGGVAFLLLK